MASLQTLRNKGGIIVAGVIGLALVAFVLGDLLTSGSQLFGASQNNVGEINGTKISYQEYSNQLDYLTEIKKISDGGNQSSSDEANEALRNQTWEQLIRQYALKPDLEKIGLITTVQEMKQLIGGSNTSPMIMQMFSNPETGQYDPEYLRSFVSNISQDKSGRLQMFWNYLQQEVSDQSQLFKYKYLVDKAAYVTTLEAKKLASLEGTNFSVRFVADRLDKIADSTVTVSDGDAKKFYEDHKRVFRSRESRSIDYVVFQALPSEADYAAASTYINSLTEEFKASQNVLQFATLNSQNPMETRYYKEGELTGELGTFAFSATTDQVYGPSLAADQYTIARVSDVKVLPDSVDFSHIALMPNQKATADSLVNELRKKDANFAVAAAQFSLDNQTSLNGGKMGTVDPQTMPEVFSKPLLSAKKGDVRLVTTPQSLHVIKINSTVGESKKVQLATIKYTIEPSEATRNLAFNNASAFATDANSDFPAAVNSKSLSKRTATVGTNDRNIQGLPASRELARWAYTGKQNEVSKVMEFGDNFVVASITKITETGESPYSDVKSFIISMLQNKKKGEMLAAKMAGATSVDELATKLSLNVIEATDVNFATYIVPEIGLDPSFAGGICGMDAAKLSKPIIGQMAVYAAQIVGTLDNQVSIEIEKARLKAENEQRAFTGAYQAFIEMSDIKDLRYKFF